MMFSGSNKKHVITIPEVEKYLGYVESCIRDLEVAVSQLPKVEEDGSSECRFAKQLYEKKEEAQKKLASCLSKLSEYQRWTDEQIDKCKKNLMIISANGDRLNNDLPQREFTDAEVEMAAIYKKLVRLRVKLKKMVKKSQKALEQASKERYPADSGDDVQDDGFEERAEEAQMDDFLRKILGKAPKEETGCYDER